VAQCRSLIVLLASPFGTVLVRSLLFSSANRPPQGRRTDAGGLPGPVQAWQETSCHIRNRARFSLDVMDFSLSETERALVDSARRLALSDLLRATPATGFDHTAWQRICELGVFEVDTANTPAALARTTHLLEALGAGGADRGLLFAAGAHFYGCLWPVLQLGTPAQRQLWGPALGSGRSIGALAITEPVAQLKTRASRFERIRADAEMKPGQILIVTEYLKPGAEELADMLPESLGRRLMRRVEAGKSLPFLGRGIHVATTSIAGNLMLRTLSAMRKIRRKSLRYVEEQKQIEIWLEAMKTALARSPEFAGALAELPRLLKGYGETHLRGKTNYAAVFDTVVAPAITSGSEAMEAARLRKAIGAALADPESDALSRLLAEPRNEPPQLMAAQ